MKRLLFNIRYWAVGLIGGLGFMLITLFPESEDLATWFFFVALFQLLGWGLLIVSVKLFKRWARSGKIDISKIKE